MAQAVLITGASGFIGAALVPALQAAGCAVSILIRSGSRIGFGGVRLYDELDAIAPNARFDAVINLAGEPISRRWSESYKRRLIESRVGTTEKLVALIERLETKPKLLISASAVGYYGAQGAAPLDEEAPPQPGFTHSLCAQWEEAAEQAQRFNVRTCITRLGIVIGRGGGALRYMLPAFQLGVGGYLGDGAQFFSWIHREDVVRGFQFLMEQSALEGVFNLCAPLAVSNAELTRQIAQALRRPALFPLPGFAVRLLFGEMGDRLLLHGQNVIPKRLAEAGFEFRYPNLPAALEEAVTSRS